MKDRQLAKIDVADVLRRVRYGMALNARQLAVAAGVGYSQARKWFRAPRFPALDGLVFWEDFRDWRRVAAGLQLPTRAAARPRAAAAGKSGALRLKHD